MKVKSMIFSGILVASILFGAMDVFAQGNGLVIETDTFRYQNGICRLLVEEPVIRSNPDERIIVVTGIMRESSGALSGIFALEIDGNHAGRAIQLHAKDMQSLLSERTLHDGDVLYLKGNWGVIFTYPEQYENLDPIWMIQKQSVVEYLGTGTELFGSDFLRVVRHEVASNLNISSCDKDILVFGDTDEDGEVSLTDVITLNRNLLGVEAISGAQQVLADVNADGAVDASDSLQILQYTVHLTDSLG